MFGMGMMEIFLIAIVAIIALGPEKLPSAMVDIAKFFRKLKNSLDDAKSTLDQELKISELKAEAAKYKSQVENLKSSATIDNILADEFDAKSNDGSTKQTPSSESKQEPIRHKVTFDKKEQENV